MVIKGLPKQMLRKDNYDKNRSAKSVEDVKERLLAVLGDRSEGAAVMRWLRLTALDHTADAACADEAHWWTTFNHISAMATGRSHVAAAAASAPIVVVIWSFGNCDISFYCRRGRGREM